VALEHDGLGIVEQPLARDAAEVGRSADQRARQRLDREIEHELAPHRARVAEHDHERPELALAAGHGHAADVGPIDLRLLAGQGLDAQIRLGLGLGPDRADVGPDGTRRAGKATVAQHVVDPRRAELGILAQRLLDELGVRLEHRRAPELTRLAVLARVTEHAPHDVSVNVELRGDCADRPVLAVVQAHDLALGVAGDRHRRPPVLRRARREPREVACTSVPRQEFEADQPPEAATHRTPNVLARGACNQDSCRINIVVS